MHVPPFSVPGTVAALVSITAAAFIGGCGNDGVAPGPVPSSVTISPSSVSFESLNETESLTATVRTADGEIMSHVSVSWTSADDGVATVSAGGVVEAVGSGTSQITATVGAASGTAEVVVTQRPAEVSATSSGLDFASLNETQDLSAVVRDPGGSVIEGFEVSWSSLDEAVATVTPAGVVTALDNGSTSILAIAGEAADTVEIVVAQQPAQLGVGIPQGADVAADRPVVLEVVVRDALGSRVTGSTLAVTIELEPNDQDAVAIGSLTSDAIDGIAIFDDLRISRAGRDFEMAATAEELSGVSDRFDVRLRLTSISMGRGMACGMSPSGEAYCWGRNRTGGLGIGRSGGDVSRPTRVVGDLNFTRVTAGSGSNVGAIKDGGGCGLTSDGSAYCWGRNDSGQLGDGSGGVDSDSPVQVAGGLSFQAIGMGRDHTCGLDDAGSAFCWGANGQGQLGDGNQGVDSDLPVAVTGALTYSAIFVGNLQTCALSTSGDVYCWGRGGPTTIGGSPTVDEPTILGGGLSFARVGTAASLHFCGVTEGGGGYCWGQDSGAGELGTGTPDQDEEEPAPITGGHAWQHIGVGIEFSCGLRPDGSVMCWGGDTSGQLGTGTFGGSETAPAQITGGIAFTQIDVGPGTTCGITASEEAYCWGAGLWGERGDGTNLLEQGTPVRVVTP